MRGVGQALDPVEVGHIVVMGLGEVGPEVAVALAPDDQRRRRDRPQLCVASFGDVVPRRGSS